MVSIGIHPPTPAHALLAKAGTDFLVWFVTGEDYGIQLLMLAAALAE